MSVAVTQVVEEVGDRERWRRGRKWEEKKMKVKVREGEGQGRSAATLE